MAALSSKLGAGVPTIGLLANKSRVLAVGAVNLKVGRYTANITAGILGKYLLRQEAGYRESVS